jgi:hypothetical protein
MTILEFDASASSPRRAFPAAECRAFLDRREVAA